MVIILTHQINVQLAIQIVRNALMMKVVQHVIEVII